jgi:hypothetical protein
MPGGRPRRTSKRDKDAEPLVRRAVEELATVIKRQRRPSDASPASEHLLLAVSAARLAAEADRVAQAHVTLARKTEGATWEQVGEAFGTSRQSAHERFRSA